MKPQILFTFYRNFYTLTFSVTLFNCFLLWQSDNPSFIIPLLWTKIIVNLLAGLFFWLFKKENFYFYYNLGYSLQRLFIFTFLFDMSIWILFSVLIISTIV